jgi:hypothetical protein
LDETEPESAERRKRSAAVRQIVVSLAAGGIFAAVLVSYLMKATKIPEPIRLVATSDAARGPDDLQLAQRVASAFVASLAANDFDGAYAQMAPPYRDGATPADFRAAWSSRLLTGPSAVKLGRASSEAMQTPDGRFVGSATFTARGMLAAKAGALEVSFTFLRDGADAHVLAVFVGGVPVVQGLGAPRR